MEGNAPVTPNPMCAWKADTNDWVLDRFAIVHHLPHGREGNGLRSEEYIWKGKGEAKLYCGYCFKWTAGRAIDRRVVFDSIPGLNKHLREHHDVEKEDTGCCVTM
jgi:hypothetical protein